MHDVACEFERAAVRSKDAQKQLARTSLEVLNAFKTLNFPISYQIENREAPIKPMCHNKKIH